MKTLLAFLAIVAVGACARNPAPLRAPPHGARVCVTNDGYALISVQFRQRDVTAVHFRSVAPGLTECRPVMLGNRISTLLVESDDQGDELIEVGLVGPGNILEVSVPRRIAHTSVMERPGRQGGPRD